MKVEVSVNTAFPRWGRGRKIAFIIFSVLLGAGAVIPVIVNAALNGRLTWSLVSLGAVVMAWLIIAPWFVFPRNRALISWGAMVLTIPLYLGLIESLAPAKGWLLPLGLPAAALGLAALGGWTFVWVIRKVDCGYAVAISFSILALLTLAEYLLARPYLVWDVSGPVFRVITLCTGGISTLLFVIAFLMHRLLGPWSPRPLPLDTDPTSIPHRDAEKEKPAATLPEYLFPKKQ